MNILAEKLKESLRQVADFPKPGINFIDITTLLKTPSLFREVIDDFANRYREEPLDAVVAIEARGFILGSALALALNLPLIPIRKAGKLPAAVENIYYSLEYGKDSLEIHRDALKSNSKVLIVDDLIATGGTTVAAVDLLQRLEIEVHEVATIVELGFLNPRARLKDTQLYSQVNYDQE